MLHELEHTVQYARGRNGESSKLCEYMAKSVGAGFNHDAIDMEQAADRKADYLLPLAYAAMYNQNSPDFVSSASSGQNQIFVTNDTNEYVVFSLETATYIRTEQGLPAHTSTFYTGGPTDTWFNIYVSTLDMNGIPRTITYGLPAGSRQHLAFNNAGLVDVFHE